MVWPKRENDGLDMNQVGASLVIDLSLYQPFPHTNPSYFQEDDYVDVVCLGSKDSSGHRKSLERGGGGMR